MSQVRKRQIIIENASNPSQELSLVELQKLSREPLSSFHSLGSCGDVIYLYLEKKNNFIKKAFFATEKQACYLTVASANIFCFWIEKKSIDEIREEIINAKAMLRGKKYQLSCFFLEAFASLSKFPSRVECVDLVVKSISKTLNFSL